MIKEPIIREALPSREALVGDISIHGVLQPQSTAVFDVRVTDSDAPSYLRQSPIYTGVTCSRRPNIPVHVKPYMLVSPHCV